MSSTKQSLKLNAEEDKALRVLYRQFGVTTDNLPRVPTIFKELVDSFNGLTGRSDSQEDLLHYMMTRRKKKRWEKLGRDNQPITDAQTIKVPSEYWPQMDALYEELQIASDNFAFDEELSKKFATEFARRTGMIVPPLVLAAAVITRRKAAGLATLKPRRSSGDLGFSDIDEVAG